MNDSLIFRPGPPPFTGNKPAGSAGSQQVFIDKDPAAPTDITLPAISIPSDGSSWTSFNPTTGVWS